MSGERTVTAVLKVVCDGDRHKGGSKPLGTLVQLDHRWWLALGPEGYLGTWENLDSGEDAPVQLVYPIDEDSEDGAKVRNDLLRDAVEWHQGGEAPVAAVYSPRPRLRVRCPDCRCTNVEIRLTPEGETGSTRGDAFLNRLADNGPEEVTLALLAAATTRGLI